MMNFNSSNRTNISQSRPVTKMVLVAISLVVAQASGTLASDFSNLCRSADGEYRIDNGTLTTSSGRKAIKYRVVKRRVIRHKRGYCTDNRKKDKPFQFEYKSTMLMIEFKIDGKTVEKDFACELYADGLPAALNCDREIRMLDFKDPKF